MATKTDAPAIFVFCPTHKKSFHVLPVNRILCEDGTHTLAQGFPTAEFWEYCCDCQRFWPSDLNHGGQSQPQCRVCGRQIARRYLCGECKVMSVESDDATVRRKRYMFTAEGAVSPECPGCSDVMSGTLNRHECEEIRVTFTTPRDDCPFCEKPTKIEEKIETKPRAAAKAKAGDPGGGVVVGQSTTVQSNAPLCPHCGAAGKPDHQFCKKCGGLLKPKEAANSVLSEPASSANSSLPGLTPFSSQDAPAASATDNLPPPRDMIEAADLSSKKRSNLIRTVLIIGTAFVVLLGIFVVLRVAVGSSTTSRLDDALKRGNLVSPAGSSARDYYNQLKNENASQSTLAAYRERLLPQLTRGPQSLLDDLTSPGGRDGTLPEWEDAQKLLAWATELKPEDKSLAAKSAYAEGRTAYLQNRIEDALSAYQRAADLDQSWAPPFNSMGSMLNEHKRYSESRGYLRQAIRRNPNWALPYNNMGTSYFYENNFSDAQSNYRKAVSLAPNWARPHAWLGSIASKQKDYCGAVGEFEQALRLSTPGMSNWDPQKIQRELDTARERCVVVHSE